MAACSAKVWPPASEGTCQKMCCLDDVDACLAHWRSTFPALLSSKGAICVTSGIRPVHFSSPRPWHPGIRVGSRAIYGKCCFSRISLRYPRVGASYRPCGEVLRSLIRLRGVVSVWFRRPPSALNTLSAKQSWGAAFTSQGASASTRAFSVWLHVAPCWRHPCAA